MIVRHMARLSYVLFGAIIAALTLVPAPVMAASAAACNTSIGGFLGFPTWYKYLNPQFSGGNCNINFSIPGDVPKVLLAIFEIILRVGGIVAVIFVIYGGFQYILSQGEPENTKGARSTIINALIGFAIAVSATAIVNLIGRNLA